MVDRHLLGDVALAVLIAVPTAAFARPQPVVKPQHVAAAPSQHDTAAERRPSLLG